MEVKCPACLKKTDITQAYNNFDAYQNTTFLMACQRCRAPIHIVFKKTVKVYSGHGQTDRDTDDFGYPVNRTVK